MEDGVSTFLEEWHKPVDSSRCGLEKPGYLSEAKGVDDL